MIKDKLYEFSGLPETNTRQNIHDANLSVILDFISIMKLYLEVESDVFSIIDDLKNHPISECEMKTGIQLIVERRGDELKEYIKYHLK